MRAPLQIVDAFAAQFYRHYKYTEDLYALQVNLFCVLTCQKSIHYWSVYTFGSGM